MAIIRALSVRQPWAWAIVNLGDEGKDIENRDWSTSFRGRFLVHASKGGSRSEYADAAEAIEELGFSVPKREELPLGGIVGAATLTDCVQSSSSPWFCGPYGLVLNKRRLLPFVPCIGHLGFWRVEPAIVDAIQAALKAGRATPTSAAAQ